MENTKPVASGELFQSNLVPTLEEDMKNNTGKRKDEVEEARRLWARGYVKIIQRVYDDCEQAQYCLDAWYYDDCSKEFHDFIYQEYWTNSGYETILECFWKFGDQIKCLEFSNIGMKYLFNSNAKQLNQGSKWLDIIEETGNGFGRVDAKGFYEATKKT